MKYYPPKSDTDLQLLHKAIVESKAADHSKLSALYYTLLDFDEPTKGGNYSAALEKKSFLPQKYQIFVRGLWYLDCQNYDVCSCLSSTSSVSLQNAGCSSTSHTSLVGPNVCQRDHRTSCKKCQRKQHDSSSGVLPYRTACTDQP